MSWLQEKYAHLIAPNYRNFRLKNNAPLLMEFSCEICGDSETNKHKARGYIYAGHDDDELHYKCHNCNWSGKFSYYMKQFEPDHFRSYSRERRDGLSKPKREPKPIMAGNKTADQLAARKADPASVMQPLSDRARAYLDARQIPDYADFRSIDDMRKLKPFLTRDMNLRDEERLLMPVLNGEGRIIGVSCRSLEAHSDLRYMNLKFGDDDLVYCGGPLDASKPILVVEGIIDSKFLNNTIAVLGSSLKRAANHYDKSLLVLVYDNEFSNSEIVLNLLGAIEDGFNVVIWPESWRNAGKDINEMIQNGKSAEQIAEVIEDHILRGRTARNALSKRI